jgi:hypothetical protein
LSAIKNQRLFAKAGSRFSFAWQYSNRLKAVVMADR